MTPQEFIAKWQGVTLSERSACQQHFLDLCEVLGQPKPAAADPTGAWYTFERGVRKTTGGNGWADVWMRGHFGWEYKGKHKDLAAAYRQLLLYREDLENPPLLVVCDLDRFEIHTNFTGTLKAVHAFDLNGFAEPKNLDVLRKAFTDPNALKPGVTAQCVTEQAAELIGQLADGMRVRNIAAPRAAHFLMKLMFCMFAEDIELLPGNVFSRIMDTATKGTLAGLPDASAAARFAKLLQGLFDAMAHGGLFGTDEIMHFNGGLFADADVIELTPGEMLKLRDVARLDWSGLEPSIFGTLFERTLDPEKRSQIGAHFTGRDDIVTLLEPVLMSPLRREWAAVKTKCEELTAGLASAKTPATKRKMIAQRDKTLRGFVERLAHVTILDPACGSGNFLYVALHLLLDLEKEVITFAARHGLGLLPQVRPTQLAGIEINPYAQELASVVIWIGYLQWMHHNGFNPPNNPVLEPIQSIRRMDAILDLSDPENPKEPEWPKAEVIAGNPPFLGDKLMRAGLGDGYVDSLRCVYKGRVPGGADLCCYWFEKGRATVEARKTNRVGLLATQGIRGGANRDVLKRIKTTGDIFFAESDRPWVLDGANVHVSMVGFGDGSQGSRVLDGRLVGIINSNLTASADVSSAKPLPANSGIAFIGTTKGGSFDLPEEEAVRLLHFSGNPNRLPNSDVLKPIVNGLDILRRKPQRWLIDNEERSLSDAALFEAPHRIVVERVKPARDDNRDKWLKDNWWKLQRVRPEMRASLRGLSRFIATPRVAKHRVFVWFQWPVITDDQTVVFASEDDYFFGVLHSRLQEVWALRLCTRLETRPRYTPTTCFDPFPSPTPANAQRDTISEAAKQLDQLRNNWLNPPEWTRTEILEFPGSADGPWKRYIDPATVDERGIGTVRYPRLVPKDAECAKELKKRTLTNLYNQRPTWLDLAHRKLDEAVFAAYGWDSAIGDDDLLAALLALNLERASASNPA